MGIIQKLRGLTKSSEFEERIPELEDEIERADGELAALRKAHEQAIFDGTDSELKAAEKALQDHAAHLDTLRAALSGSTRRRDEALKAEEDAEWQKKFESAMLHQDELRQINIEGAKIARALADLAERERRVSARVDIYNRQARGANRSELTIPSLMREITGQFHESYRQNPNLFGGSLNIPTFWNREGGRCRHPAPVEHLGGKTPKPVSVEVE